MDLPINVNVECADGTCGHSTYIVLHPISDRVTHLVVQEKDFPMTQYLVSVDQITHSDPDHIHLRCTKKELSQMETFIEDNFLSPDSYDMDEESYMIWPFSAPAFASMLLEYEHIPPGESALRRGANVYAIDGYAGKLDEFLIDPTNEHITHLIMREGHLWGRKVVTISVSDIDHIDEDTVFLKLSKKAIGKLPTIPLRLRESKKYGLHIQN